MPIAELTKPNLVFFITDQQRFTQHWPAGWAEQHLPTLQRLQNNGLTFLNMYTAACECSPSRASMATSTYPQENGVEVTFTTALDPSDVNIAAVLGSAGYDVHWKGKWHLSFPVSDGTWSEDDIANLEKTYGVRSWNPPDAGTALGGTPADLATLGGGNAQNDSRFVTGTPDNGFGESVLDFIHNYDAATARPFCLVVSLVNPHDLYLYPNFLEGSGYTVDQFENAGIPLPTNQTDDLTTKPCVQQQFQQSYTQLTTETEQLNYVNFYAWLHTLSDALFGKVLDALEKKGLIDDTIVFRYADHGEMGLSHNLQEKMYTAYEEAIHIPLVVFNPKLYPSAQTTTSLASSLDLLPTIAEIAGSTNTSTLRGKSLVKILDDPSFEVQDCVIYTFDDEYSVSASLSGHIRCIRMGNYKYAVYYTLAGSAGNFEYELYDLVADPGELTNLVFGTVSSETRTTWTRLHKKLTERIQELHCFPDGIGWPAEPPQSWTRCVALGKS